MPYAPEEGQAAVPKHMRIASGHPRLGGNRVVLMSLTSDELTRELALAATHYRWRFFIVGTAYVNVGPSLLAFDVRGIGDEVGVAYRPHARPYVSGIPAALDIWSDPVAHAHRQRRCHRLS